MIASCKNNLIYGFAMICQSSLADDMTTRWIILVGMEDLLLLLRSSWQSQVLRRLFNDMQIMENINSLAKKNPRMTTQDLSILEWAPDWLDLGWPIPGTKISG